MRILSLDWIRFAKAGRGENSIIMADCKKQAIWGGRFSEGPAELMLRIGESVSFDQRLAPFDIQGSQAQAAMLAHVGIITLEERDAIQAGLDAILAQIESGRVHLGSLHSKMSI
jgi:argininosuccinate lyase